MRRTAAALEWLQQCVKCHRMCNVPDPDFVPRRVVDVVDDSTEPHLIDGETDFHLVPFLDSFRYAALSYCWGPGKGTFTTTRMNLEQNKHHIALSALPLVCKSSNIMRLQ